MAGREDFSYEQWATMHAAMLGAPMLVCLCEGGGTDMIAEMMAVTGQIRAARQANPNQLVRELAAGRRLRTGLRPGMSVAEFEVTVLAAVHEAAAAIRARAPEDMPAYRDFLLWLSETAAGAHREGGFLGVGGTNVSPVEEAVIARIRQALADR